MLEKILEHNRKFVRERRDAGEDKPISGHARKDVEIHGLLIDPNTGEIEVVA